MRTALVVLGMTVEQFYCIDPFELSMMLDAAIERRKQEHEDRLRLAAFIVNAMGTRSRPLDIEQILSSTSRQVKAAEQNIEAHTRVRQRLMAVRRPETKD